MPQRTVRRSKNWKFSHAAAAMGAFWERARKREALRIAELRRATLRHAADLVAPSRAASAPLA